MKKLILIGFLMISFSIFGQVNDTLSDITEGCLRNEVDSLSITFENDSIYISGIIEANCAGPHALIRKTNQDTIQLIATDSCQAYCLCPFSFNTVLPDEGYNPYLLKIGYVCSVYNDVIYYLDTLIYREPEYTLVKTEINDPIGIYPNPVDDMVSIKLLNSSDIIKEILFYSVTSQQLISKQKTQLKDAAIIMDLSSYQAGLYIVEVRTKTNIYYKELIVL